MVSSLTGVNITHVTIVGACPGGTRSTFCAAPSSFVAIAGLTSAVLTTLISGMRPRARARHDSPLPHASPGDIELANLGPDRR
jgi:hypothetical protein